ncbi:hypothetical protein CXF72_17655 [Psychromonas sp. MB-3u-54]|nr:hypothetical protein CXF72_17655 [Psychromonas sp. MB-3u-54]
MKLNRVLNERLLPLIFFNSLFLSAFSYADDYPVQPYFIADSFSYSETVSIESTLHGWEGDNFESGEQQWTWNWFELGVQYQHWAVGIVQRYDYALQFSPETADFFWLVANKKDLPVGKQYDLNLQVNALHSSGVRVSYANSLTNTFNYRVGLTYLQANYMINGQIKGNATAVGNSDYDYQAALDYAYTTDDIFDRVVDEPTGKGFALDLEFSYQITPSTHWQFQVRDLFAKLYWKNSPYTEGNSTSERKEYDENGYVSINPILTGYEGTRDVYVQKLQPRWYSKVSHQLTSHYTAVLQYRYQYDRALFSLGGNYKLGNNNRLGVNYWPINQAAEINWNYHKIQLAVVTDALRSSAVKTFGLSFSYGL